MRTFEYKLVHCTRVLDTVAALNKAGAEGWEVVCRETDTGRDYSYLLKRETAETAPPG